MPNIPPALQGTPPEKAKKMCAESNGKIILYRFFTELKESTNVPAFEAYLQDEVDTHQGLLDSVDPEASIAIAKLQTNIAVHKKILNIVNNCHQFLKEEKKRLAILEKLCHNSNITIGQGSDHGRIVAQQVMEGK